MSEVINDFKGPAHSKRTKISLVWTGAKKYKSEDTKRALQVIRPSVRYDKSPIIEEAVSRLFHH